jgi:antitoxin component of MazEF toxin-antitoxin module
MAEGNPKPDKANGPVTLKIVSVGNSKGVRIPSDILRRQGMANEVECIETTDGILLRARRATTELSFEEAFAQMAKDPEALADVRELEGAIGDGLEQQDSN